jgi:hypothetical protein
VLGHHRAGVQAGGSSGGGEPFELIDWDAVFAYVVHALGWGWTQAEAELDLHRLQALTQHWRQHPPTHLLVAAYLQYEPPKPAIRVDETTDLSPLLASTPVVRAPAVDDSAWQNRSPT